MKINETQRRNLKKGFKNLRTAFKWLFIILLVLTIIYMLLQLLNLSAENSLLIERVNKQDQQLTNYQWQLEESFATNTALEEQLQATRTELSLQQDRIDELVNQKLYQQEPKVFIDSEPFVYKEVTPVVETPKEGFSFKPSANEIPLIAVGILTVARVILRIPIPAF